MLYVTTMTIPYSTMALPHSTMALPCSTMLYLTTMTMTFYAALVYGILRKCGSASATPLGGKDTRAHTAAQSACKFTELYFC